MMNRNRIRIWGRKTSTLPTPEITPSEIRLRSRPGGRLVPTHTPRWSKPALIASMAGWAQVNTAWNIRKSTASRMAEPAMGCSSTSSNRPVRVSGWAGGETHALRMLSASRWARRSSAAVGSLQVERGFSAASCARRRASASRASRPRRRVATVVTTGMASSRDSRSTSMRQPCRSAMSNMLSASTMGRPTCFSSSTRRSTRRRLVASATQISTSGAASPGSRPSTTSRVTTSSGLRARSE